ncbi:hypothetical protein M422DRAFT_64923 [Sphaerobolus stellatus SS14]|nr:hypothetical protein M422DRAFT_64923 [Sphaerobolus stellatus SS14]
MLTSSQTSPRDAKSWLAPLFRRRRGIILITSTFVAAALYFTFVHQIGSEEVLRKLGFVDALWDYPHVNTSSLTFPPHDPQYLLFEPSAYGHGSKSPVAHFNPMSAGRLSLPEECIDDHFAKGLPCYAPEPRPMDVVWTWVNGSDRLLMESMSATVRKTDPKMATASRPTAGLYRDHDELRHSVRSVLQHFRNNTRHLKILTSDFDLPLPIKEDGEDSSVEKRLGLVPSWLNLTSESAPHWTDGDVGLEMVFHSQIFKDYDGSSFNSLAIESQFAHLDVSENFIYMNDDFFMLADLATSDFYTSAYGVVLRMQSDLLVKSVQYPRGAATGEWPPLEFTNYCISSRFGSRQRPYIAHTAKSLSLSLLKEFHQIWESEFGVTASHPFRGMWTGHRDIYAIFLFIHTLVERWREALLWSWAVGKHGGLDDEWDDERKRQAWIDLGGKPGENEIMVVMKPRSSTNEDIVEDTLLNAGQPPSGKTSYEFVSGDGYPYGYYDEKHKGVWPNFGEDYDEGDLCTIKFDRCLDWPGIHTASGFFTHVAFKENIECGDCIIDALRSQSGEAGLSAFLPDPSRMAWVYDAPDPGLQKAQTDALGTTPHLPLVSDWKKGDFTLRTAFMASPEKNVRKWTLRLLERYRFVIGQTPTRFHMITSVTGARNDLKAVDRDKNVALLCLNDNIVNQFTKVNAIMMAWQDQKWGTKAAWER